MALVSDIFSVALTPGNKGAKGRICASIRADHIRRQSSHSLYILRLSQRLTEGTRFLLKLAFAIVPGAHDGVP